MKENKKVNELSNHIVQIEAKANERVTSFLGQSLRLNIPFPDQEKKPAEYWKGVRDMASYAIKQWNQLQDDQKFVAFLEKTRANLLARVAPNKNVFSLLEEILKTDDKRLGSEDEFTDDRDLESPPTPYVYEFPYPKGPPAASAEAIPIKKKDLYIEDNSEDQLTPQDTSPLDSPSIKPSPATPSLPEKLLDDKEELLSVSLKEALKILRDEVENEENG